MDQKEYSFKDLLFTPFVIGETDCWWLAQEVFKRFGITLPEYAISREELNCDLGKMPDMIERKKADWTELKNPVSPCLIVMMIGIISAEITPCGNDNSFLGTLQQGDIINLKQVCDTCTHVNVSRINYPDSTFNNLNEVMTKSGTSYNLSFSDTFQLGCYSYDTLGNKGGVENTSETIYFQITPSGSSGNDGFYILVILLIYGVAFIGFFGRNEWITLIGGLAMMFLGVYIINTGIVIFRDTLTNAISYFTIVLGAFFALYTGIEIIQNNYN